MAEFDDEYYLPDEEEVSEKKSKEDKKLELAILKEQNKAKQLENEANRLAFEKEEAKAKREFDQKKLDAETQLEEKKIKVSEKQNEISEQQVSSDNKKSKREVVLGFVKAAAGIFGVVISVKAAKNRLYESMKFEETGSFTTATGRDASAMAKDAEKDLKNLDKKF